MTQLCAFDKNYFYNTDNASIFGIIPTKDEKECISIVANHNSLDDDSMWVCGEFIEIDYQDPSNYHRLNKHVNSIEPCHVDTYGKVLPVNIPWEFFPPTETFLYD